jgi:hypothetical protein
MMRWKYNLLAKTVGRLSRCTPRSWRQNPIPFQTFQTESPVENCEHEISFPAGLARSEDDSGELALLLAEAATMDAQVTELQAEVVRLRAERARLRALPLLADTDG